MILLIYYSLICQAQSDSVQTISGKDFNLKLSSNSSLIYPGLSAGIELNYFRTKDQNFIFKSASRSFLKSRFIAGNVSWYHHPFFHDNIYITVEWIMRRTRSGGFTSEFSFGPGFSRTFLSGTTYKVSDNGNVSVISNAGYKYALLTLGGGLGYDLSMRKKIPLIIFSKMNMISMFPYNSTIYFRPVLELGVKYK